MKVRTDFVTNSSSTSFCIIGIDCSDWESNETLLQQIADAVGLDEWPDGTTEDHDGLTFVGYGFCEPAFVGLDAEEVLKTMTIPQACDYLHKMIKERYGLNVPLNRIEFYYGEVSNE